MANEGTETRIAEVQKLASLARIDIPEGGAAALAAEFESVLAYIGQLDELHIASEGTPRVPALHNVFREDTHPNEPGSWTDAIVRAFPAKSGNSLSVKKIISHD